MKTSLFLLATAALQALAAPSTSDAKLTIKAALEADSLANIYLDYGTQSYEGHLALSYGSCKDGTSTEQIGEYDVTLEFQPDKFSWHVPVDA